jgi:hypothetical protein
LDFAAAVLEVAVEFIDPLKLDFAVGQPSGGLTLVRKVNELKVEIETLRDNVDEHKAMVVRSMIHSCQLGIQELYSVYANLTRLSSGRFGLGDSFDFYIETSLVEEVVKL